ncbi:unnamed protein product [Schistosoma spindalis]|nr:unnamed protein product [Schistosoma spindale]
MSVSLDDLKTILQIQQAQNDANQMKLLDALMQKLSLHSSTTYQSDKYECITNSICEFHYDPESGIIFNSWFHRCEDIFRVECSNLDDAAKVRLLLRRLGTREYNKYVNFILPRNPRDLSFKETVQILSDIFGEQSSLFNTRYRCFQISKSPDDDYLTYAGKVNRECELFKINEITADQFKCLIFICGLKNAEDADVRTRMLARIEQEPNMTLQMVTTECQRLVNLKHDTAMVQQKAKPSDFGSINALRSSKLSKQNTTTTQLPSVKPPSPCWFCGAWHFAKLCPFKNHKCRKCHRIGHKEGHCSSNKRKSKCRSGNAKQPPQSQIKSTFAAFKVGFQSKRKYVNLLVNEKPIRLQLDTASDVTLISKNTWRNLGYPRIRPTEHVARNASGDIVKLTGEVTCNVKFMGHKFTDVCYLTNRHDLDLLGLDWIEKVDTLNKLLNEVCSQNASFESIKIPDDISKSNTSDKVCSRKTSEPHVICANVMSTPKSSVPFQMPKISPKKPWSCVQINFAGPFQGTYFLICVDAYSKWPEIIPMNQVTSQDTIMELRQLFSRFGVPNILVSDNGTQFTSSIFSDFCKRFGVNHVRSPPYHPQSNGQAERFVDTFKRALLKGKGEGKIKEILNDFLFVYRTTPNPSAPNQMSPAEIMFGRKVKTALDAIKPERNLIGTRNRKMVIQFNRHHGAKNRIFRNNQTVYVRDFRYSPPQWTSGLILKRRGNVMYVVEVEGQKWTRHVNHILENSGTAQKTEKLSSMWQIFLDSFDIKSSTTHKTVHPEQDPIRRSLRKRRRPDVLQVDPKKRAYVSEGRYQ